MAACGKTGAKTSQPTTRAPADDPSCPLLVPGTSVSVEDMPNGAALVFVTTGDPFAVRARAAALAEMHTTHDGPPNAFGMMFSPGSTAIATEVEGGARVELTTDDSARVPALQQELRAHASHLTAGSCGT